MMPMPQPRTTTIVGLEIHVQLRTRSKMFCGCAVDSDAPPNTRTCPVCLGHPGSLPVINRTALELAILMGLALNCRIARLTKWDRKNYFYPDMPKNYQISQYDLPVAADGYFDVPDGGRFAGGAAQAGKRRDGVARGDVARVGAAGRVRIRRAHLEEDAGKNIHDVGGGTLVDANRAGTPLLEIVTEPDIRSAGHAYTFATELQRLVTYLGVSEGNMQKGQMRFEPNVNVEIEHDGRIVRTPIAEIKNLNSFRSLRDAIDYESRRQVTQWLADPGYVLGAAPNENRGWDDDRGATEYQRPKEAAHDYRYFPDPDLKPVAIDDATIEALQRRMGELPIARRQRFERDFGLSGGDAATIVSDRASADLMEAAVAAGGPASVVGKQFVNVWLKLANERGVVIAGLGVAAARMGALARLAHDGTLSATAANAVAEAMLSRSDAPERIAAELGLVQVQDTGRIEGWIDQALAENPQAVADAANPKKAKAAVGFLRGQVMKISGGKADPKVLGDLIEARLRGR